MAEENTQNTEVTTGAETAAAAVPADTRPARGAQSRDNRDRRGGGAGRSPRRGGPRDDRARSEFAQKMIGIRISGHKVSGNTDNYYKY